MKKAIHALSASIFWTASLIIVFASLGHAQTLTVGSNQLILQEGSQITATDLTSDNSTLIITPPEGADVASVKMQNATQTIFFYGRKISVQQKTTDFQLEGNGRIEWDDNVLIGPKEIIFDSASDTLKLYGTKKNPASIHYTDFAFDGKAEWFFILGKRIDGNWTPANLKSGPIIQGTIGPSAPKAAAKSAPGPKITAPKN
ncbi:MAG: hypothetical protein JXR73_17320 [Candidatus Omnitrophica bacterium]|nr:hypothetical protein [Candidatus Omnitrophota bacterium]